MDTDALIGKLSAELTPVRRASASGLTLRWCVCAIAVVAAAVLLAGVRPDLAARLADPRYDLETAAAILVAVVASFSGFKLSLPGSAGGWVWLSVAAVVLWLGVLLHGAYLDRLAHAESSVDVALPCVVAILSESIPLNLVFLAMARHAARLRPILVASLGGLASAAAGSAGDTLCHGFDLAVLLLIWHAGPVFLATILWGLAARPLFRLVDRPAVAA